MFRRRSRGSNTAGGHASTGAPEFKYVSAIGKGEINLDLGKGKKKPDPFGGIVEDADDPTDDTASEDDRLIRAAVSALGKQIAIPEQHPAAKNKFAGQVVEDGEDHTARSRSVRFTADTKPAAPLVRPMRSRSLMGGTLVRPKTPIGPTVNPLLQTKNVQDSSTAQPKLKNKVGKANLARDIPIFLGVMGALFGVALMNNDIGSTKGKPSIKGQMKQAKVALEQAYERQKLAKEAKRQVDCNLFLADSSIPGAGYGLFVGTTYQVGDQVVEAIDDKGLSMLVKHHPLVTNIDENGKALVDLLAGDELFLAAEKHPTTTETASVYWQHHVFIPTYTDYALADEIIADEIRTQGVAKRIKRNSFISGQSSGDGGGGGVAALKLIKRTVSRMQPRIANLLPVTSGDLLRRKELNTTSAIHAMRIPDLDWLELNGHCIDMNGTNQLPDVSSSADGEVPRPVKLGQTIVTLPLLLALEGQQQRLYSFPCFGSPQSSLRLCPALPQLLSFQTTSHSKDANARLEWSDWNKDNERARDASLDEVVERYLTKLSLDIIATKPVAPGDRIRVFVAEDSSLSSIVDFPDAWKVRVEVEPLGYEESIYNKNEAATTGPDLTEVNVNASDSIESPQDATEETVVEESLDKSPVSEESEPDVTITCPDATSDSTLKEATEESVVADVELDVAEPQLGKTEERLEPIDTEAVAKQPKAKNEPSDLTAAVRVEQRQEDVGQQTAAVAGHPTEDMNVGDTAQTIPPEKPRRVWRRNRQMM